MPFDIVGLCSIEQASLRRLPLRTSSKLYGFLIYSVENLDEFLPYEPYVANLANIVAVELERRSLELTRRAVQDQLHQVLQELESEVVDRTAELAQRNAELEREIQSRNSLEKALRLSEERYRSLILATTQIVWSTDPLGEIIEDLPSWRAFTGQTETEIKGHGWNKALHPEDRHDTMMCWLQAVKSRTTYHTEYRLYRHDGEYRHVAVRGIPILEADGTIREWIGTCTDITEQKLAEETLQRSHEELEIRVRERTSELAHTNEVLSSEIAERKRMEQALRETDRHKDEFLAMLAHELRNPLAPIRHALHVLKKQNHPDSTLEWGHTLIDRQVTHMARLLDDLLDVARIIQNKIRLQMERCDLTDIIAHAVEDCLPLIEERKQQLVISLPDESQWVEGDATRLEQIITNLLNNAAKYTEENGKITISAVRTGIYALIRVEDTGIGIAPDLLAHVFDLFTQADRSLAHSQGGLGLGLTLVRRLVEKHGGTVTASSAGIGQGSTFTVRLPLLPASQSAVESVSTSISNTSASLLSELRILVVDDYADAAESLTLLLQAEGHEVETADCGLKALERAQAFRPQVVLLDIGLPDLDGYEVARRLRTLPETREAVLVALTGYGQTEDRERSRSAGFNHHLLKPVNFEKLSDLLASA
ncbi:hybrid sensor histidine kinase/response regulator [Methylobacter sp. YRD-M1]|uniref:hybrid sensor histidine kinase/response regulator n=1 Tax=Methylobacter sp. YRD-M1 TaxID=2911520 RepID=UPI00227A9240|nr:ATP-binding protein [Methylobacter sp. YRD-M1]WAK03413.1 ATP-binding protein [Methylobacter sp. YRD-M1]